MQQRNDRDLTASNGPPSLMGMWIPGFQVKAESSEETVAILVRHEGSFSQDSGEAGGKPHHCQPPRLALALTRVSQGRVKCPV